jgi:hypothetical protein
MKYRTAFATSAILLVSAYGSAKMTEKKTATALSEQRLLGTWKSNCQVEASNSSVTSHVTYTADAQVTTQDQVYASADCTGPSTPGASETMPYAVSNETPGVTTVRFYHNPASVAAEQMVDVVMEATFASDTEVSFKLVGASYKTPAGTVLAYPPETFAATPVVTFTKN